MPHYTYIYCSLKTFLIRVKHPHTSVIVGRRKYICSNSFPPYPTSQELHTIKGLKNLSNCYSNFVYCRPIPSKLLKNHSSKQPSFHNPLPPSMNFIRTAILCELIYFQHLQCARTIISWVRSLIRKKCII